MTQKNKNGVVYLSFPELERIAGLRHLFSTRKGGVSRGEFSQMNFSFTRGDDPEAVRENYRRISEVLGYQGRLDVFVTSYQTHTVNIRRVRALDSGKGVTRERDYRDIDGLITNERGLVLTTFHADCTPLYFVDEAHHAIGLAHSGWRGTVNDMAGEMVRRMGEEFGTAPGDLVCAIGPCICGACYEVGRDVYDAFEKKWGREELQRYISKEESKKSGKGRRAQTEGCRHQLLHQGKSGASLFSPRTGREERKSCRLPDAGIGAGRLARDQRSDQISGIASLPLAPALYLAINSWILSVGRSTFAMD